MSKRYFFTHIWWVVLLSVLAITALAIPRYSHYLIGIIGFVLLAKGAYQLFRYNRLKHWPEHVGRILSLEQVSDDLSFTPTTYAITYYYPKIKYEYEVGGTIYRNNRVGTDIPGIWVPEVNQLGDPIPDSDRFWHAWKVGSEIPVYVNPAHHEQSILVPIPNKTRYSHSVALVSAGVILILVWGGLRYFILEA